MSPDKVKVEIDSTNVSPVTATRITKVSKNFINLKVTEKLETP